MPSDLTFGESIAHDLPASWRFQERLPSMWDQQFARWAVDQLVHDRKVTLWRIIKFNDSPYLFLVIDDAAHLIQIEDGRSSRS